jgi:hypothetical protein
MTEYEKKNNVMHFVQTALMTVCTAAAIGCFIFLWNLNAFMAQQIIINDQVREQLNAQLTTNTSNIKLLNSEFGNHETRISIIETEIKK